MFEYAGVRSTAPVAADAAVRVYSDRFSRDYAMPRSRSLALLAVLCLAAWIVLAFVLALPTGWVHLALVAAVLLIVRAIVAADEERAGRA